MDYKKNKYLILLICATAVAFSPILKASFLNYDDPQYVTDNYTIKNNSFQSYLDIFMGKSTLLYVPFTILSFKLDFFLFEQNAQGYHFINLIIHLLNIYLLFRIFQELNLKEPIILYSLLFFSISPLVTESVCWIAERKDLLYCLFYFLAFLRYLRYIKTNNKTDYLLALIFFIFSCLSKPMAVSLPLILLIYLYYSDLKNYKSNLMKMIPFVMTSLIFSAIALLKITSYNKEIGNYEQYKLPERIYILVSELGYYFFKPFLPFENQLIHLFPEKDLVFQVNSIRLSFFLGLCLSLFIVYRYFKHKDKFTVSLFLAWIVILLPILQIVSNTHSYVSERYFYLSIIFPVIITIQVLKENSRFLRSDLVFLGFVLAFVYLCFNRSTQWKNSKTLFTHELKVNSECHIALNNLAMFYNIRNDFPSAFPFLKKALNLQPKNPTYLNNYGWCLAGLKQLDSALIYFKKSLYYKPHNFEAINNLGVGYANKNELDSALFYFKQAERIRSNDKTLLINISGVYSKKREPELSKFYFVKAKKIKS